jgi:uncharacterized protein (DUF1501 family)
MLINPDASRRQFLRTAGRFAAAGVSAPLALNLAAITAASAQTATDYRALVCLYIGGGNDAFNTFVPYDTGSYNAYASVRRGLAVDRAALLPLAGSNPQGGRQMALNPALLGVKSAYDAGRAAVVANIGNLIAPLSKGRVGADPTPSQLFSHVDQWLQSGSSRMGAGTSGWVGLMGDLLAQRNAQAAFTSVSMQGYSRHLDTDRGYFTAGVYGQPNTFIGRGSGIDAALTGAATSSNLLEQTLARVNQLSRDLPPTLAAALPPEGNFAAVDTQNELMVQMRSVARHVAAHSTLGIRRQVFYVTTTDPYDNHNNMAFDHPRNLARLNAAITYLDTVLGQMGMRDKVTLFTTSEFGRCLVPNGDGTDHGWGAHHLVMGGAVARADVYGSLPNMDRNGPDLLGDSAPLLPSTANIQLAATLGRWMGVSGTDLDRIFPDLGRFSSRDLGLLRA